MNIKLPFRSLLLLPLFLLVALYTRAQLTVSRAVPYNSVNYLVKNILLGNGVLVSNITYTGDDTAVGFFNGIKSNIGMDSGVLLTTGTVTNAPGPNNNSGASYAGPNCVTNTDPDLQVIAGTNVDDAAIIQFDFVATSDTVKFQYVFGSEEYPEFVNSFNDAFGFFVSGPGITGPYTGNAENIAILPDTVNTPVTIDSVNCNVHANYYVCNWPSSPCADACPTPAQMPSTTVQYDGFTTVLTAYAVVECGQTYHIKIAIADAGDCAYDSGVFLKSGSFSSNGSTVTSAVNFLNNTYPNDTILYRRSCETASIYFERGASNSIDTILIDTSGTAVAGVDYTPIPDTIIMPIGVTGDTINISALSNLKPGLQTLNITIIQNICGSADTTKLTIYIGNPPPMTVTESPVYTCYNDSATLIPTLSGGVGLGYFYKWSNGDTTSSITVHNIKSDTTFMVMVTDGCGDTATDTVHVAPLAATPLIIAAKDTTVNCPVGSVSISASASGGNPGYKYLWNTGGTTTSITVSPSSTTVYTVSVTDSCGHTSTDSVKVTVKTVPLVLSSKDTTILCSGVVNLSVSASGGGGGYTYNWSNGSTSSSMTTTVNQDTSFIVTVTTPCGGQTKKDTVHVTVLPPNFPIVITGNTSICKGQSTSITASGGGTYSWSTGSTSATVTLTPGSTTTYTLTVTNGNCVKDTTVTINVANKPVITITPPNKICVGDSVTLTATGGGNYVWSNGETGSSITVKPSSTTSYTVVVDNGCIDSSMTSVSVDNPGLTVCCDTTITKGDTAILDASGTGSYTWTPIDGLSCFTCPNPIATPTTTTTYTVITTDSNGCTVERTVTVVVEIPCSDFNVPNVFTPNNDGINDDFVIRILNPSGYSIVIYDRWGKQVYTSSDPTKYWNGRLKGTNYLVPDGVYYYVLKATCGSNNYVKKGFVQVLGEK